MTSSLLIASLVLLFTMLLRCSIRVTALTLVSQNSTISGSADGDWFETSGVDFSVSCGEAGCVYLARENTTVTILCGKYETARGISFTYYIKGSQEVLINEATDFPRFILSWYDSGTTVCCAPNTSSNFLRDSTCYLLNVTYSPRIVDTKWPAGSSKWPVYDESLIRICPLKSNPPAQYSWRRYYDIIDFVETNISMDVRFTKKGRQMEIPAYQPELHNGLYVCYASNALGSKEYFDVSLFYLHTEFCDRFKTANISKNIAPSGDLQYRPGDDVVLNCSFYPVQELSQRPYWFFISYDKYGNMTLEYVESSNNTHQEYHYDKSKCIWKNTLMIFNFSDELSGTYSCGYSYHIINQTLRLEEDGVSLLLKSHQNSHNRQLLLSLLIIFGTVVVIGFLISVAVCVRWKMIRSSTYSTSKEPPSTGFVYDVFLSAHDEVRGLVQHKILHQLENHEPPYKVCWHLRDFTVGLPINEQIVTSILESRKILFVFSEHFTESQFCCSELDQALHRFQTTRTRCILPIVLDEDTVPKKLKSMLTYWPLVNLNDAHFLEKITKLLGDPMNVTATDINEEDTTRLLS